MSDQKTLQHRADGPPAAPVVVLGPSLGATWHMWDRQIPELTRHWRVVRFDLPGHGGAPADPASAVADLADRLLATLDQLGVERFAYAGCDIGGAIGTELVLRHPGAPGAPGRVAALALVSSSARYGTPDAWRRRGVVVRANGLGQIARGEPEQWFTPPFRATQGAIVDWAVQMVSATDTACYVAACEALATYDVRAELGRITIPTLVVTGAEDPVTPPADARVLVAGIRDAGLALIPGASHLTPVEQPAAVGDLLVRHLAATWTDAAAATTVMAAPVRPPAGPPAPPVPPPPGPSAPVPPVPAGTPEPLASASPAPAGTPGPTAELSAGPPQGRPDPYEAGMRIRREVLGDAHVDRAAEGADEFTGDFQDLITRYAWGEVWTRPGLDRRTRSCVTLTALVARGHLDELAFHTRAALRNGLSPAEIKEVLLQTAVYCGVPAANSAFAVAQRVIREETDLQG